MSNFRRALLYSTEIPVNAVRLDTTNYTTTLIKKFWIPVISNNSSIPNSVLNQGLIKMYFWYYKTNGTALPSGQTSNWYSYDEPYDMQPNTNSLNCLCFVCQNSRFAKGIGVYFLVGGYLSGSVCSSCITAFLNTTQNPNANNHTNDFAMVYYNNYFCNAGVVPSEIFDETFDLENNTLYVCVDARQLSPDWVNYPYVKFTGQFSEGSFPEYPIYIEPAD